MIKQYVGTHALFQCSNVVPQAEHSKLFTSRDGAIDSVRRYTAPHWHVRCCSLMSASGTFRSLVNADYQS